MLQFEKTVPFIVRYSRKATGFKVGRLVDRGHDVQCGPLFTSIMCQVLIIRWAEGTH